MFYTTKELLHEYHVCKTRYKHFFSRRPASENELIPLVEVLDINGFDDAVWCLQATTKPCNQFARLFAADLAERVLRLFEAKYPDNHDLRRAIETGRRLARGEAGAEELIAVRCAAAATSHLASNHNDVVGVYVAAAGYLVVSGTLPVHLIVDFVAADAVYAASRSAADGASRTALIQDERDWQIARFREALIAHGTETSTNRSR